jgi:ribosomal protein S1
LIQRGDMVRFHTADIVLPSRDELPKSLAATDRVEGTVVEFSDSGSIPDVFAVVDVVARQSVIVPVNKLESVPEALNPP